MSNKITLENIENILKFLPLFSSQDCQLYDIRIDRPTLDPYYYSKEF